MTSTTLFKTKKLAPDYEGKLQISKSNLYIIIYLFGFLHFTQHYAKQTQQKRNKSTAKLKGKPIFYKSIYPTKIKTFYAKIIIFSFVEPQQQTNVARWSVVCPVCLLSPAVGQLSHRLTASLAKGGFCIIHHH